MSVLSKSSGGARPRTPPTRKVPIMRKVFVILDCETLGNARKLFDLGWIALDSKGNELERFNALVSEVVESPWGRREIATDEFTSRKWADGTRKSDWYLAQIDAHSIPVMPWGEIMRELENVGARYNAQLCIVAYNSAFDVSCIKASCEVYGVAMPSFVEIDLWAQAINHVCATRKYRKYCEMNDAFTPSGFYRTNAETVGSYLLGDLEERHTALADCEVEAEIWRKVRKRRRKQIKGHGSPFKLGKRH